MFPVLLAAATLNRSAKASTSSTSSNYTCHQRHRITSTSTASSSAAASSAVAGANRVASFRDSDSSSSTSDVDEVNELWQVVEYAEPAIRLVEILFGKRQSPASSPLPPPTPQPSPASLTSSSSSEEVVVDSEATQTSLAPPATTVARNTPEMNDSLFFAQMDLGAFAVGPVAYNDIGEEENQQNTPVRSTSPRSRRIPSPTTPTGGGGGSGSGSGGIINFLFRRGGGGANGRRASVQLPAQPVPQPSEQQQKRSNPGWFSKRRASVDDGSWTTSGCSSLDSSSNPSQTNSAAATSGSLSPSSNHNATTRSAVVSPSNGFRVQSRAMDNVANGHLPKSGGRPDTLALGQNAASGQLGPAVPSVQIAPRNIDRRAYASGSVVPPPNFRHQAAVEAATSRTSVERALPANRARQRWQSADEKSRKKGTPSYRVQYQQHRSPPARTPSDQTTMSQLLVTSNSRLPPSGIASPIGPDEFLKLFRSRAYSADCRDDPSLAATLAKVRQQHRQRSSNSISNSLDGSDVANFVDSDFPSSSPSEMSIATDVTSLNEIATHSSSRRSSVDVSVANVTLTAPIAASTYSLSEPASAPPESSAVPGEVSGGVDSAALASRLLKLSLTTHADVPDTIPEHVEVHHQRRGSLYSNCEESDLRTDRLRRQAIMAAANGVHSRSRRFSDPLRPNPNNMAAELTSKSTSSESKRNETGSFSRIMRNFPKFFTNTTDTKHVRGIDLSLHKRHLVIWRDRRTGTKIIPLSETTDTVAGNSSRRFTADKNLAFVDLLRSHSCYDLMPKHANIVSFDVKLDLICAFDALIFNGKKSALLWDSAAFRYIGMLTITDFIRILHKSYFLCPDELNRLDQHNIERWREMLREYLKELVTISADQSVYEAVHLLHNNNIRRLLVYDAEHDTETLYVLTKKRILFFIYAMMPEKDFPEFAHQSIGELDVGTYNDMATITMETTVIDALDLFVERRVSSLPVVDENGRLINAFAKYDTINLVSNQMYKNLDNTVKQVLSDDDAVTEGVYVCRKTDSLADVIRWLVNKEIHRLWVVGDGNQLEGVVSLSDVVHYLVIRQASATNDDSLSQDLAADDEVCSQTEKIDTTTTSNNNNDDVNNNNNHANDENNDNDQVNDDTVDGVEIDLQMVDWSAEQQQTAVADELASVPTSPESGFPSTVESSTGDLPAERQLFPPLVGTEWNDIDAVVCDVGTIWPPASPGEAITGDVCRPLTRPVVDNDQFLSAEATAASCTSSSSVQPKTHSCELFNEFRSEMDDANAPELLINKPLSSNPGRKSDRVHGQTTDCTTSGLSVTTPRVTSSTSEQLDLKDDSAYTSSNGLYNGDDVE